MYPVYVLEDNTELPQQGEFYVVCGNGTWFHKETDVFSGYIPVISIPFLKDLTTDGNSIKWVLPKVPHDIVMKVKQFFVRVFKKYRSEACVILYFNKETEQYSVVTPLQWTTGVSVKYIRPASDETLGLPVGTIHSHCDFNAFHSGTDHEDESTFDGLHVTFGDIVKPEGMSISASLVVHNMRCSVSPLLYLDGISCTNDGRCWYKITPPSGEVDYNAWSNEVDSWVAKVNHGSPPTPWTEEGISTWLAQGGDHGYETN